MVGETAVAGYSPPPYPKAYLVPGIVILLGQAFAAVSVYPRLPEEIPLHFSGPGTITETAATSPLTAGAPVFIGALVLLLLAGAAALVLRTVPTDRAEAVAGAKAVLAMGWVIALLFTLICAGVWFPGQVGSSAWFFPAVIALAFATVLPVIVTRLRHRSRSTRRVL
ncbi:DUF1648 domain-containing protein [Nocardiopsis halophila]|uniref:DUF1648 domain-containing protein n=1 Tax=Nocardiopsis halophila TaxID=141692 RepID=UPI000368F50E|nr:DUF1648 domain-containing protein [Nocardiopsis halophila]